jgi:hypothetical protein
MNTEPAACGEYGTMTLEAPHFLHTGNVGLLEKTPLPVVVAQIPGRSLIARSNRLGCKR